MTYSSRQTFTLVSMVGSMIGKAEVNKNKIPAFMEFTSEGAQ